MNNDSKNDPIKLKNDPIKFENDPIKLENDPIKLLLNLIIKNPEITIKELIIKLGKSEKTIKRYLKTLKNDGYIERVGSKKVGSWKVIKKNNK